MMQKAAVMLQACLQQQRIYAWETIPDAIRRCHQQLQSATRGPTLI